MRRLVKLTAFIAWVASAASTGAAPVAPAGAPAQLDVRAAGEQSIRVTLKSLDDPAEFPFSPALVEREYPKAAACVRSREQSKPKRRGCE